jgi:DNA polymerase sigma
MFFVIKSLCCNFRLSEPKSGGLRTYALIIMLLSCISKWNSSDLGKLLIDFLFYFGFYYDYLHERRE